MGGSFVFLMRGLHSYSLETIRPVDFQGHAQGIWELLKFC